MSSKPCPCTEFVRPPVLVNRRLATNSVGDQIRWNGYRWTGRICDANSLDSAESWPALAGCERLRAATKRLSPADDSGRLNGGFGAMSRRSIRGQKLLLANTHHRRRFSPRRSIARQLGLTRRNPSIEPSLDWTPTFAISMTGRHG